MRINCFSAVFMKKDIKKNKGSALIMTLMILASVLIVTLGAANLVTSGIVATRLEQSSTIAYYAAETGIEKVLWDVRKELILLPDEAEKAVFASSTLENGSSYIVDFASSTLEISFTSVGTYKESSRSIQVNWNF